MQQTIELSAPVLDVAFLKDIMYVSLDAKEGQWIAEFERGSGKWTEIDSTKKWQIAKREESSVELYWLETMRKRTGQGDEE